jgi:hypothetical protein
MDIVEYLTNTNYQFNINIEEDYNFHSYIQYFFSIGLAPVFEKRADNIVRILFAPRYDSLLFTIIFSIINTMFEIAFVFTQLEDGRYQADIAIKSFLFQNFIFNNENVQYEKFKDINITHILTYTPEKPERKISGQLIRSGLPDVNISITRLRTADKTDTFYIKRVLNSIFIDLLQILIFLIFTIRLFYRDVLIPI